MNDNNDQDDKKNGKDPFDFFKLSTDPDRNDKDHNDKRPRIPIWLILLAFFIGVSLFNWFFVLRNDSAIDFSEFKRLIQNGQIVRVEIGETYFLGFTKDSAAASGAERNNLPSFLFAPGSTSGTVYKTVGILTEDFLTLLDEKGIAYKAVKNQRSIILQLLFNLIIPVGILFLMYRFIFKRMGGLGGSIFSAGQSRAAAVEEGKVTTRFSDVAGVDEAKEELVEVVDFLKSPQKYTEIGGKIPRGVLLVGPPGTGKTLLARAVAGEAGVPFFRISGSDFVEMFVGVGASRVRDLFKQAREKAPCIVFIDELDAIGKSRINSISGGNDEREQTLNQLLVEMDGFDNTTGLILLGATNRPDVLDPALLRPGRFDRQVVVDRPDVQGREAILKIHAKNVKLDDSADLSAIAKITSGCSGADLANIINEAALLAVRCGRKKVSMTDLSEAVEKATIGLQKKSKVIREEERRVIAYHETGHAIAANYTEGADKVHKVTIIPRGTSTLGYTFHIPEDDKHIITEKQLLAEIDVLLGGRAAEQVAFGVVSTGASNDLMRAADIARSMIADYGMSSKFKNVALSKRGAGYLGHSDPQLVREYAESTQQYIDEEIARIIDTRYEVIVAMLTEKKTLLEYIANRLLEKETIEQQEFDDIIKAENELVAKTAAAKKSSGTKKDSKTVKTAKPRSKTTGA
ncbi:ATP-dependent metallopeptidase FtsH/Yme1/Tma family protein [Treponema sp. OMZ 840]|uniref:ATP-dependent zinc metalloprotease FtsH n=1 Tax=Treponema sp. OMZ 840 TaxID=244313 RepID=UPI003D8EFA10